jgi:hypothetical protein
MSHNHQVGDERARQREAIIERSMCYRSNGSYWFANTPSQAKKADAKQPISNTYPNPIGTLMDDKSQPLV